MKHTLLVALLLLSCSSSFAQKWEVGLNAGIAPNTFTTKEKFDHPITNKTGLGTSIALSVAYKITHHIQVGVAFNPLFMYRKYSDTYVYLGKTYNEHWNDRLGLPTMNEYLYANYKINHLYAGVLLGYSSTRDHDSDSDGTEYLGKSSGLIYGAQIGYTYPIYHGWGVNAQIQAVMASVKVSAHTWNNGNVTYAYFPCTLGVHYKF